MPASKPHLPYLFHISNQDMEAGNRCSTRPFHMFHMFHICFTCAHIGGQARTHVHAGVHPRTGLHFDMEDMEHMEEGHRTSVSSFHISTPHLEDMEPKGENKWN